MDLVTVYMLLFYSTF